MTGTAGRRPHRGSGGTSAPTQQVTQNRCTNRHSRKGTDGFGGIRGSGLGFCLIGVLLLGLLQRSTTGWAKVGICFQICATIGTKCHVPHPFFVFGMIIVENQKRGKNKV